jgi:hypothetical protein
MLINKRTDKRFGAVIATHTSEAIAYPFEIPQAWHTIMAHDTPPVIFQDENSVFRDEIEVTTGLFVCIELDHKKRICKGFCDSNRMIGICTGGEEDTVLLDDLDCWRLVNSVRRWKRSVRLVQREPTDSRKNEMSLHVGLVIV